MCQLLFTTISCKPNWINIFVASYIMTCSCNQVQLLKCTICYNACSFTLLYTTTAIKIETLKFIYSMIWNMAATILSITSTTEFCSQSLSTRCHSCAIHFHFCKVTLLAHRFHFLARRTLFQKVRHIAVHGFMYKILRKIESWVVFLERKKIFPVKWETFLRKVLNDCWEWS